MYIALKYVKNQQVAEEIVGDSFIKVVDKIHPKVDTLLIFIVKNKCLDYLKRKKYELPVDFQNQENIEIKNEVLEISVLDALYKAIERLSIRDKELINMLFFRDKTCVQAAKELNLNPDTIRSEKRHIINRLRKIFKEMAITPVFLF
jgi:RNA polymerase sigma factor (sigma-70 family)